MSGVPVGSPQGADPAGLHVGIAAGHGVVVRFGPTVGVFGAEAGPDELRRMQGEFDPWPSAAAVSTESTLEESLRAATEAIDRSVQRLLR